MTPAPNGTDPGDGAFGRTLTNLATLLMMVLALFALLYGVTWLLDRADLVPAPAAIGLFVFCTLVVSNNALVFWASYGFPPGRVIPREEDESPDPKRRAARERWLALPEGDRPARGYEPDRGPEALFWPARAAKEFVGSALWFYGFLWVANRGKADPRAWGLLVLLTALYAGFFRLYYGVWPSTAVRPPRGGARRRSGGFEADRLRFLTAHARREIPPEWSTRLAELFKGRK